jgi:(4S)-4-hydroxy-5-phosphonooxypentane-2,3-dione isomerase
MIVRAVSVYVKPQRIDEFINATKKNHRGSVQEPGVLRFDVLQRDDDPSVFMLYEVYRDEAATAAHKETEHYKTWRQTVEPMMAKPREGTAFTVLAPESADRY